MSRENQRQLSDRPDTGWRALTLLNSWTGSASYRVFDGAVYFRGTITPGTLTDATAIFTMPSEARPDADISLPALAPAATSPAARASIAAATGSTTITDMASATSMILDGMSYKL